MFYHIYCIYIKIVLCGHYHPGNHLIDGYHDSSNPTYLTQAGNSTLKKICGYLYRKRLMLILGVFSKGASSISTLEILL